MKFSSSKFAVYALLLALAALTTPGCGKIKALVAKKPLQPSASPAATPAAPGVAPVDNPAEKAVAPTTTGGSPAAAAATSVSPRPATAAINKNAAVMVLCYHRLELKPHPKDELAITPQEFEKEMQQIKDGGFAVIPMQDFLAWRRGDKDIPARSCVITIDDGYVSGYDTAWPILKKFGYPFTMFVYINYINSGGKSVSWDQLAEMRDAGVDIQSHTYYHDNLRNPPSLVDPTTLKLVRADIQKLGMDGYMQKEIVESKQILEKQLGIKVNCLAYPYGNWSPKVRELVKEAGYEAAFTVYGQRINQSSPPYDILGRYAVSQTKPLTFQEALTMQGGGAGGPLPANPAFAQAAASSMITQPMEGETITNSKPVIKANLATMGDVDPKSVEMRISGLGKVNAQYDAQTKTVTYAVPQPLKDKNYSVILNAMVGGKRAETRWDFSYDPSKGAPTSAASPQPAGKP